MVKRKMKKVVKQKQKQKQNVNVKQNVKVVVGDAMGILRSKEIKKKRAVKSSGAKSGAGAKPPIVLNISQPQPYNNPYMMYFKEQLQNQQPIQANTLAQFEKLNEREENKASKVGALHNLDQDPGKDQERELRRQAAERRAQYEQAQAEKKAESKEISGNIQKLPKAPKAPKRRLKLLESVPQRAIAESIASNLDQQQIQMEERMMNLFEALEEEQTRFYPPEEQSTGGAGAGAGAEEEKEEPLPAKKGRGRPKGSLNKTEEEKEAEKNKPKRRVGRPSKAEQAERQAREAERIRKTRGMAMSPSII